jgi:hypothetical protein
MATAFSRWVPFSLPLLDGEAKLKLRAFNKREAPEFKRLVTGHFEGIGKREGETDEQHTARSEAALERWRILTRETFVKYVKVAEPMDIEGEVVETGAQLYDEVPGDFSMRVMLKLAELASLGDTEGKSSGSQSTSTVEAGHSTASSDSPATTPAIVPSPTSSTVVEMPEPLPFSRQA